MLIMVDAKHLAYLDTKLDELLKLQGISATILSDLHHTVCRIEDQIHNISERLEEMGLE